MAEADTRPPQPQPNDSDDVAAASHASLANEPSSTADGKAATAEPSKELKEQDTSSADKAPWPHCAQPQLLSQEVDSVTDFVGGLSPFISALEHFDGGSPTSAAKGKDGKEESVSLDSAKIEEKVMRPIRELIYKSFHEPSEGEE